MERSESGQITPGGAAGILWVVVLILAAIALVVWLSPHIN